MSLLARCWVLVSDDDERCVTGIHMGDEPGEPLEDGFVWEEYVRADHHRGALDAERAKFHEYVRQCGRLGYDGPHLDHFLATYSATPGRQ
jgi:hypothetical protein